MKRLALLFLVLATLFAPVRAKAQTAVSGNLVEITNAPAAQSGSGGVFVRFRLQNFSGTQPKISNTSVLAHTQFDCNINSTGCSVSSAGVLSGTINGNDVITPPGTYYTVEIWYKGAVTSSANYNITGPTWNLNTATPLNVQPPGFNAILGALTFVCTQGSPSSSWTCNHNFHNSNVLTECFDSNSHLIWPDTIINTNNVSSTINWINPTSGQCTIMNAGSISFTNLPNAIISNPTANQVIANGMSLELTGLLILDQGFAINPGPLSLVSNATVPQIVTFPDNSGPVAELNLTQFWTQPQTFTGLSPSVFLAGITINGSVTGSPTFTQPTAFTGNVNMIAGTNSISVYPLQFNEAAAPVGPPANFDLCYGDNSLHRIRCSFNTSAYFPLGIVVGSGTATLSNSVLTAGSCATAVNVSVPLAQSSDSVFWSYNSVPGASDTKLIVTTYAQSSSVGFIQCNNSAGSLTPSGLTVNFQVVR